MTEAYSDAFIAAGMLVAAGSVVTAIIVLVRQRRR